MVLVKTTGFHFYGNFEGVVIETNGNTDFSDGQFSPYFKKESFVYHGEIPQEHPSGQKTAGVNFIEAIIAFKCGKNVARAGWGDVYPVFMYHSNTKLYWQDGEEAELDMESFLATDWQIIEP